MKYTKRQEGNLNERQGRAKPRMNYSAEKHSRRPKIWPTQSARLRQQKRTHTDQQRDDTQSQRQKIKGEHKVIGRSLDGVCYTVHTQLRCSKVLPPCGTTTTTTHIIPRYLDRSRLLSLPVSSPLHPKDPLISHHYLLHSGICRINLQPWCNPTP